MAHGGLISQRAHADEAALVCSSGRCVRFGVLRQQAAQFAGELGDTPRGLILCLVPRTLSGVVAYLACMESALTVLPLDGDSVAEIEEVIRWLEPELVIGPPSCLAACSADVLAGYEERETCLPATLCLQRMHPMPSSAATSQAPAKLVLRTSGSLGKPKWVRLSQASVLSNAEAIAQVMDISPADRGITSLPLAFSFGLSILHSHLHAGSAVVLTQSAPTHRQFWRTAREQGVKVFCSVPRSLRLLRAMGWRFAAEAPRLRLVCQAGGPIDEDTTRHWWQLTDGRFAKMYGQTEATARISYLAPHQVPEHPGSVGRAIPGGELRISAEDDAGAGVGVGEVFYRGPNVMQGYLRQRSELDGEAQGGLQGAPPGGPGAQAQGVRELATGDLGFLNHGFLTLTGRRDRMVKIAGRRVQLEDIEAFFGAAGEVAADQLGERLRVFALDVDSARQRSHEFCVRVQIAPQDLEVIELPKLPLTRTGKIDYTALKA